MSRSPNQPQKKRISSLEMADQMFKDAFLVKKMKFAQENPQLSEADLKAKTAEYFRKLSETSR